MASNNRLAEAEVAQAVTRYLFDAGGSATIKQIRRALPYYIEMSPNDRSPSTTRPREEMWEQQVRNIVSHRHCEGNPIKNGTMLRQPQRLLLPNGPQGELF